MSKVKKRSRRIRLSILSGEIGQKIFENISKEAWQQWQSKQTMLINEHKLNMMNPEHRQLLEKNMVDFLFHDADIQIDGFVPPES